jgi:hypothetical protein
MIVVVVLFASLGKLAVLVAEHNQYKQRMLEVTEKVPSPQTPRAVFLFSPHSHE